MRLSALPSVRLFLAFASGIVLQDRVLEAFDPSLMFYLMLPVCVLASVVIHRELRFVWISGLLILVTVIVAGMKITHAHHELHADSHFSKLSHLGLLSGVVDGMPEKTASGYRFPVKVNGVYGIDRTVNAAKGNLQVYLKTQDADSVPDYGEALTIRCTPQRISGPLNPDAFDFSAYMHTLNLHFQVFTRPDSILLLGDGHGNVFWSVAYRVRSHILKTLGKYFQTPSELGVAEALLVGYKGHLPDEVTNAYIETGSMHVLAVSGAHVGIIFMGMVFFIKQIPIRKRWFRRFEVVIILLSIWLFAFLAGMGPSIARATVMFSFYLIARAFKLDYEGYNVMAASAFCLLLYDPFMLFQVSFQLSFLAVLGMMLFYPTLYKYSPILPKWADYFWKIFLLGVAAQIGTLPLTLLYFGQFPTYFWLSGLVVVPIATLYMFLAIPLVILDVSMPMLAAWVAQPVVWMVKVMNWFIYLIQKLPFALVEGIWLRWWDVLLLTLAVAFLAQHVTKPRGRYLVRISVCLFGLALSQLGKTLWRSAQQEVVVYHTGTARTAFLDFVQGHRLVSLASGDVPEKMMLFSAKNHRVSMGLPSREAPIEIYGNHTDQNLLVSSPPFIQNATKTYAFIDRAYKFSPNGQPIEVEALILDNQMRMDPEQLLHVLRPKQVVLCQNLSRRTLEQWTNYCSKIELPIHVVGRAGAWVHKLK